MNTLEAELRIFLDLKYQISLKFSDRFISLSEYGFGLKNNSQVNLMIFGLTHGNEVIGLQTINLFLSKLINYSSPQSFYVRLNNIEAYLKNKRFIDKDLNRSFLLLSEKNNHESRIANCIKNELDTLKPFHILDLHQTVEPTEDSFFITSANKKCVQFASVLEKKWPIILLPDHGFSSDGFTLIEYSQTLEIPALVLEVSQNGFDFHKADALSDRILRWCNSEFIFLKNNSNIINENTYKITYRIEKVNGLKLIPNLKNRQMIKSNQKIGEFITGQSFISPCDGLLLFPKYGQLAESSTELALLAEIVEVS